MNASVLAIFFCLAVLAHCAEKEVRKQKCDACGSHPDAEPEYHHGGHGGDHCLPCKDDCKCLPKVDQIGFSAISRVKAREDIVLYCAPGSYFKRIEYHDFYVMDVTCNGITIADIPVSNNTYVGIKDTPIGEQAIIIRTRPYHSVITSNQGSLGWYERAELDNYECAGHVLTSYSTWRSDNVFSDCCTSGANRFDATYFKLEITAKNCREKCCSVCYQASSTAASMYFDKFITN